MQAMDVIKSVDYCKGVEGLLGCRMIAAPIYG